MFGSTPGLSINTGGGIFGQPSQPSLFGGGLFGTPGGQPAGNALALAPYSQAAPGQQLAAPGGRFVSQEPTFLCDPPYGLDVLQSLPLLLQVGTPWGHAGMVHQIWGSSAWLPSLYSVRGWSWLACRGSYLRSGLPRRSVQGCRLTTSGLCDCLSTCTLLSRCWQ